MKANPNPKILGLVQKMGDGIDVASYREVLAGKAAGIPVRKMLHSNPIKNPIDIINCVKEGVRWFTFDNWDEIYKLRKFAPNTNILLRIAIPKNSSVVNLSFKFGADEMEALPLIRTAVSNGLRVRGITFHVGSQCTSPENYISALQISKNIFKSAYNEGIILDVLDIGGGFPIGYRMGVPAISEFCSLIIRNIRNLFPNNIHIIAEPGRFICGEAITLVTRVIGKSIRKGIPWYYIDDGIYGSFSGKLFDHCDYRFTTDKQGIHTECVVAGPTCDSIDVLSMDQWLPRLDIGDLLLVPGMGAYTSASATFFNGFAPTRTAVIEEIIRTKPRQLDSFAFPSIQEQERARAKKTEVTYSSKHLVANIGV
jgi:ornithine decarboxylase